MREPAEQYRERMFSYIGGSDSNETVGSRADEARKAFQGCGPSKDAKAPGPR